MGRRRAHAVSCIDEHHIRLAPNVSLHSPQRPQLLHSLQVLPCNRLLGWECCCQGVERIVLGEPRLASIGGSQQCEGHLTAHVEHDEFRGVEPAWALPCATPQHSLGHPAASKRRSARAQRPPAQESACGDRKAVSARLHTPVAGIAALKAASWIRTLRPPRARQPQGSEA